MERLVSVFARSIAFVLLALFLTSPALTKAEDDPSAEEAENDTPAGDMEELKPVHDGLPVEDPTIAQEDSAAADEEDDGDADEPADEEVPDADAPEDEDAGKERAKLDTDAEPTVGALPVEDPTLEVDAKELGAPDEPAEDEDTAAEEPDDQGPTDEEEKEEEEKKDDPNEWGQPVKVMYGYQTGLLVGVDDWFYLALSGLVQARYAVNYRTEPPNDVTTGDRELQLTQGFDVARARFTMGIGLTQFVALYMRIGVVSGGVCGSCCSRDPPRSPR